MLRLQESDIMNGTKWFRATYDDEHVNVSAWGRSELRACVCVLQLAQLKLGSDEDE